MEVLMRRSTMPAFSRFLAATLLVMFAGAAPANAWWSYASGD